ncbi:hypothetical protein [Clostridium intestinale]|jgi:hypothetical protein|uniref:Uncharacterized protein n=1 Tax=Clostridium intestinale TaxID=36845 RepID=A0A7D6VT27_9CLOT|nr:hypothetical protein [Clostridium intestinale]QLY81208.1 hypothetical protein HZF06_06375 [Clostridium intestinale]
MKEVISIIAFTILTIYFLIEFVKSKKIYNLFVVVIALAAIFINTPLAENISKLIENIIVFGILILGFCAIYLGNKEDKKR